VVLKSLAVQGYQAAEKLANAGGTVEERRFSVA
jgi:hypothetical protein